MAREHPDLLGSDPRPLFFPVANSRQLELTPPEPHLGVAVRTWVRALSGMQKEALVISSASNRTWRLVSDEGPYLAGHDVGPCPLSFFTTGMVSSVMNELTALAAERGIELRDLRLTLDNYYTMEGSALRGTMVGGALAPEIYLEVDSNADPAALRKLAVEAVAAAPVNGLLTTRHTSLFTLTHNGRQIELGKAAALGRSADPDPGDRFPRVEMAASPVDGEAISKLVAAEQVSGVAHGVNSSLKESQSRTLHVQGICTIRDDGVKEIEQNLFKPIGSTFRYLCDESPGHGGQGRAPDAASYLSAGIGFCFMTQFGRYAEIAKKELAAYRIVQDTHYSLGGASGGTRVAGTAAPVETHVYLETPEGDEFASTILDMSEQTCFLHALCRTELKARLSLARPAPSGA